MSLKWIALFFFMVSTSLLLAMLPGVIWPSYGKPSTIALLVTVIVFGLSGAVILPIFFRMLVSRRGRRREIKGDAADSGTEA
jgi:hypothetical protein